MKKYNYKEKKTTRLKSTVNSKILCKYALVFYTNQLI